MRDNLNDLLQKAILDHRSGRLDEALQVYRRLLKARPLEPQVLRLTGLALHEKGQIEQAITLFRKAVRASPRSFEAHRNLGVALRAQGQMEDALGSFREAIRLQPTYAEAHRNLGNLLLALDQVDEAAAVLSRAVILKPDYAEAHTSLGLALLAQKRVEQAIVAHRHAIMLKPGLAAAHNNLGLALTRAGDRAAALQAYGSALAIRPDYPEALANRAALLLLEHRLDEAMGDISRALVLDGQLAAAHRTYGIILYERGEIEDALTALRRAAELNPRDYEICEGMANALDSLGRVEEAFDAHRASIAIRPDNADAHFGFGLRLLLHGRFREGFKEYEWRRRNKGNPTPPAGTEEWNGGDLGGRRILLQAEQGLGDTLQFMRFARRLAETAEDVVVQVQEPLFAILRHSYPDLTIVARGEALPRCDCWFPLMSVAMALGIDSGAVPARLPLLSSDPTLVGRWRSRLPDAQLRIGIVWQGNPAGAVDMGRSLPLAAFAPLAAVEGVALISLQKTHGLEQLNDLPRGMIVHTLGEDFDLGPDAFLDTAAVMESLDLVVSSDTSVAHVAGCLGRPVWVLLKHRPDWRWLLERDDSPWYPSARLFRQERPGDWDDVLERVAATARALVGSKDTVAR